jgi:hypothetical protein
MVGPAVTTLIKPWFDILSTAALNPNVIGFVTDFFSGLIPASAVPASYGRLGGVAAGQAYQWWEDR